MRITKRVIDFLDQISLANRPAYAELSELISKDLEAFDNDTTDRILERRIRLEGNWSSYQLNDIDIFYEESALVIAEKLELFGIREYSPPIRSGDRGILIVYRFSMLDIFGGIMDTVTGFRVAIEYRNGGAANRRVLTY